MRTNYGLAFLSNPLAPCTQFVLESACDTFCAIFSYFSELRNYEPYYLQVGALSRGESLSG